MTEIFEAEAEHIDALVRLEAALFVVDGAKHDPFSDPTWPTREGAADLAELIDSPDAIVLGASRGDDIVGLLIGYAQRSSPTRQPVEYAVLRTMYVAEAARRLGVARALTERFLAWARQRGCAEAHVDHYAANEAAGAFYESCGFEPRSISRAILL